VRFFAAFEMLVALEMLAALEMLVLGFWLRLTNLVAKQMV